MKMKKLRNKGIRLGTLIEIALFIAILLVMLLPGGVVITPVGIPSVDSGVVLASPATERQSPDAILEQTNLSGSVSDIQDDPDGADANWLTQVNPPKADTMCRVSFPTPTGSPTVGADLQEFKIWVRKQPPDIKSPQVRIELYEDGVSLATILADTDVTSDAGQLFSATWDANLLPTADGSLVECYIFGSASAKNTVEVGAVEWNVDYTVPGDISNAPDTYPFGVLAEEATANTTLTYFMVINNSSFNVTITIGGTDMIGDFPWILSNDGSASATEYGLKAGLEGGSYNITVMKNGPYNILVSGLPGDGGTQSWGLKLWAPTEFSGGGVVSGNVTLTATQTGG